MMDNYQAEEYLQSLLGKTLRVHTTDTRMFVGSFKCTDAERNIILSGTFEYRFPSSSTVRDAAGNIPLQYNTPSSTNDTVKVDMTSRFVGLVVVPGQHITRIEVEEARHTLRPARETIIET